MGREDYAKAYKAGKKDYQARMLRGEKPTLAVLEDITMRYRWGQCRFPLTAL